MIFMECVTKCQTSLSFGCVVDTTEIGGRVKWFLEY